MPYKGVSTQVIKYLQENPNRPVTIEELVEKLPELQRHQIISAASHLVSSGTVPVERVKIGLYRYSTELPAKPDPAGQREITFTVVKETDEKFILVDEVGDVYSATLIG